MCDKIVKNGESENKRCILHYHDTARCQLITRIKRKEKKKKKRMKKKKKKKNVAFIFSPLTI
jgi:hypothetical protein